MKLQQTVRVSRSADDVWNVLGDIPLVVGCIPGAELGEQLADDRYRGTFRLKVGPLTAKIDGEGEVARDDATRSGKITGRGIDKRGGSRVGAAVSYNVAPDGGGSVITVSADLDLSGPLAQVGRTGIIEDVAKRLTDEFTAELERKLQASAPSSETPSTAAAAAGGLAAAQGASTQPASVKEFDVGGALTSSLMRRFMAFINRMLGKKAA